MIARRGKGRELERPTESKPFTVILKYDGKPDIVHKSMAVHWISAVELSMRAVIRDRLAPADKEPDSIVVY